MSLYKVRNYDKDKDYSTEINRAATNGDYSSAGALEEERNRKIAGEGLNYPKTYKYIDIGDKIQSGMQNGISTPELGELLDARSHKAKTTDGLYDFGDDEIQKQGWKYYYNDLNGIGGNMENRPQYNDKYADKIDDMLNRVLSGEKFSYNAESDPLYQQYRDQYRREGDRSMRDTLASMASGAGGLNSYAVSAAQQANNYYNSKLADKIPELYNLAYEKYMNERNTERQNLNQLINMENSDFNKYLGNMGVYQADRSAAENMYNNRISQENYQNEWKYNIDRAAKGDADGLVWRMVQSGIMPSDDLLSAAGVTDKEQVQAIAERYRKEIENANIATELGIEGTRLDNEGRRLNNEGAAISNAVAEMQRDYYRNNGYGARSSSGGSSSSKKKVTGNSESSSKKTTSVRNSSKNSNSDSSWNTINKNSVLGLGAGPISIDELDKMYENGDIDMTEDENGRLKFAWKPNRNIARYNLGF